jgi:hypothetical protein
MGGLRSKPQGTLESCYVASVEDSLGFWRHGPEEVHSVFSRFLVNGSLDRRALKRIEILLSLKNPEALQDIYNLISPPDQRVPVEHLLVFAILLTSGSSLQKAELLWDLFDKDGAGEMQRGNLQGLLGSVVNAATSFSVQVLKPNKEFSDNRLNKWREDIKVRVNKGRDTLVDNFIGENQVIKREEFFQKLVKNSFEFTTLAIRERIEKVIYVPFSAGSAFARFKKQAA